MIKRLMTKGADLSIKDKKGRTVMDICLKKAEKKSDEMKDALKVLERANPEHKTFS